MLAAMLRWGAMGSAAAVGRSNAATPARAPRWAFVLALVAASACGGPGPSGTALTLDELRDPASCKTCHPTQYSQWSGSMHAYASEDPVFRAMNQRGQRETAGALGSFCLNCHAPLAVRLGLTTDGSNLDAVPAHLRGVTCFFCHSVTQVTADHNNPLVLGKDGALHGGIADPLATSAHPSAYSTLHDRLAPQAASLCGSCHDVVTPGGVALERTYKEWMGSVFSHVDPARPTQFQTCGQCHMTGTRAPVAAVEGARVRLLHDHSMDGVDVALIDFPNVAAQKQAIAADLSTLLAATLCVKAPTGAGTEVQVTLDNVAAGHGFPSGAAQDRRAFVEVIGYAGGRAAYESGLVQDGQSVTDLTDPDLWLLRDRLLDGQGQPVHMFWQAKTYTASALSASVTNDPGDPLYLHSVTRTYVMPGSAVDRVTVRVRLTPIGLDVLADLVKSGDLDPAIAPRMATVDLGSTVLEWKLAGGYGCVPPR